MYANTGIHFNALVRESAFAPGQVQYHVHRLVDNGEIVRSEFYGQTHYYPPESDEQAQAVLALLRRGTAREIVVHLIAHERSRVRLRLENPERMAALPSIVEPTTAEQLVDGLRAPTACTSVRSSSEQA
ncbi:hypothetical protein [Natronococcus sp.]|uniref:hypothetical protein n=1 Tax=Natronococcus sp. TaxID=35747 RepID=UPI003A4E0E1D